MTQQGAESAEMHPWECRDKGHEFWCRMGPGTCRGTGPLSCNADPNAEHACSVCHERKPVLDLDTGMCEPCWVCQRSGWRRMSHGSDGGSTQADSHAVGTVRFFRSLSEHRADCSCGWTGSYWKTEDEAEAELDRHTEEDTNG